MGLAGRAVGWALRGAHRARQPLRGSGFPAAGVVYRVHGQPPLLTAWLSRTVYRSLNFPTTRAWHALMPCAPAAATLLLERCGLTVAPPQLLGPSTNASSASELGLRGAQSGRAGEGSWAFHSGALGACTQEQTWQRC